MFLNELKKEHEQFGDSLPDACSVVDIKKLAEIVHLKYKMEISDFYIDVLKFCDGFDFDGVQLYGTARKSFPKYPDRFLEGLIDANDIWHDDPLKKEYLIYGDSNSYFYCQRGDEFFVKTKDSFEDDQVFSDGEDLFKIIINHALGKY